MLFVFHFPWDDIIFVLETFQNLTVRCPEQAAVAGCALRRSARLGCLQTCLMLILKESSS